MCRTQFPTSRGPFIEMAEAGIQRETEAAADLGKARHCILNASSIKNPRARRLRKVTSDFFRERAENEGMGVSANYKSSNKMQPRTLQ